MKPEDRDRLRELAALKVLWELLAAAKEKVDVIVWRREGFPEAEDFLHALESGAPHPLLLKWENLRATIAANRPRPDLLEQGARRLVVLMCKALHRAGLNRRAARRQAAKALQGIFLATPEQIRYWQDNYSPAPDDDKLIAAALKRHGNDPRHLAGWFAGLVSLAVDPVAARKARFEKSCS